MSVKNDTLRPVSVLIISEANAVRESLRSHLKQFGCEVLTADDAEIGIERALVHIPDAILVSQASGGVDTIEVCHEILRKAERAREPVIVLIPPGCDIDTEGVTLAEDSRLIDLTQLAKAITRLAGSTSEFRNTNDRIVTQGLFLDRQAFRASVDGRELQLTVTEFNMLWQLARNPGTVLSRSDLCDECRGQEGSRCRSVDVHVRSLRVKLEDKADLLETVRGLGYRIRQPPSKSTVHSALVNQSPLS